MRKIWILATLVCLLFSISIPVFATSDTYYLQDLELKMDIPAEYYVITKDTPEDSPAFDLVGASKDVMLSIMEGEYIYLDAFPDSRDEEIVVEMTENLISNLLIFSDSELQEMAKAVVELYDEYDCPVSQYDFYQHTQAKFLKISFTNPDPNMHSLQYYTIYDNKAINITMHSYTGEISSKQETVLQNIVDSIQFDNPPPVPNEETKPFTYTDQESGVTFTVPANWKQQEFSEEKEYLDVKFVSTKDDSAIMLYGGAEMWNELSFFEKMLSTRENVNNSILTEADVAQMCKTTSDKISTVTYNGVEYFKADIEGTMDAGGLEIPVAMTCLVRIENGWLHMFQFTGSSANELYSDFAQLAGSVQYPTVYPETEEQPLIAGIIVMVGLLIVAPAIVVVIVVFCKKKKKATGNIPMDTSSEPEKQLTKTCVNCGLELPSDSIFCHVCGTKIVKE